MRYVTLKENYALRGWSDKKYAILDLDCTNTSQKVRELNSSRFNALELLTAGGVSIDDPLIPSSVRRLAEKALEAGYLVECDKDKRLADFQKYRYTEARYTHTLMWSITGNCNMKCKHCYISAGENCYGEPDFDKCKEAVRQMLEANVNMVAISGGEPLVRKDFWKVIDLILENNIRVLQIFTNGLLVTEHFLDEFQKRRIDPNYFLLSFDGVGCHDWLRGISGSEERTIEAIKRIRNRGYKVIVTTSLHMGNIGSLMETYELMKKLGVEYWKAVPIIDTGNWRTQSDNEINYYTVFDAYLKLLKRYKADGMPMRLGLGGFFQGYTNGMQKYEIPFSAGSGSCDRENDTLCEAVRLFPYLLPDGRVLPCIAMSGSEMENIAPNIYDEGQSLEKALSNSPIDSYCSYTYKKLFENNPECAACENRYRCSGCRANALSCGGYFEKDPLACSFFMGGYEEKIKSVMEG